MYVSVSFKAKTKGNYFTHASYSALRNCAKITLPNGTCIPRPDRKLATNSTNKITPFASTSNKALEKNTESDHFLFFRVRTNV